jgi:sugar phosphate isomerase/epimerase
MEADNPYNIVLPQGNADRAYCELSESERIAVGMRIFERAASQAAKIGAKPVVGHSSLRRAKTKLSN